MSTEKTKNIDKQTQKQEQIRKKEEQVAKALRENLLRRKAWIKERMNAEKAQKEDENKEQNITTKKAEDK